MNSTSESAPSASRPLLQVDGLRTVFPRDGFEHAAVDGVSIRLREGETLGLVGQSGCGKTSLALSILGLVSPPGRIESGEIHFDGCDLRTLSREGMRRIRGRRIGMVFQEPASALDPLMSISVQLTEALLAHRNLSSRVARVAARELLDEVGIADSNRCLDSYPHQLSGGMLQRVLIAIALCCDPDLLIGDEPTSSLDVTVQGQIIDLLGRLREKRRLSMLLISHDLAVVAELADQVALMDAGQIVETGKAERVFLDPCHPCTQRLVALAGGEPPDKRLRREAARPNVYRMPGCRFEPACPEAEPKCRDSDPPFFAIRPGGSVRCFRRLHLAQSEDPDGGKA